MTADEIIRILKLKPHPKEQGFFAETYWSNESLTWEALPSRYEGSRCLGTAIYFLLTPDGFSEMHRLRSDEVFHFYLGAPAQMLLLYSKPHGEVKMLGPDIANGQELQLTVPRGVWQGMRTTGDFSLLGTTVAPGFDYSDYESGARVDLIFQYPAFADLIRDLTR